MKSIKYIYANLSMLNDNHNDKLNIMYWLCIGYACRADKDNPYRHDRPADIVFPPAPKKGMVKSSRKGHFQRTATCKEGTSKRAATCKEGTFKPASFIFSPVLSSFTFLSLFTNPLEAGCCYCQPFKQKTLKQFFLLKILISTCFSKSADFYHVYPVFVLIIIG